MMRFSPMFAVATAVAATGCAIKPTPYDVTGMTTVAIVSRVKCESKEALYSLLIDMLRLAPDARSQEIADKIEQNEANIVLLKDYKKLPYDQATVFSRFDDAFIVFDFQLRMTENNNIGGLATLAAPLTGGLSTIAFKPANNKERQNFRTFRISTTIKEIMRLDCSGGQVRGINWEYPIAGNIGLKETYGSYFGLAALNRVDKSSASTQDSPFVDTLKFTTVVSGEIDPGFSIAGAGPGYFLRDASGLFMASRKDEHQLSVGVSLPPGTDSGPLFANTPQAVNQAVTDNSSLSRLIDFGERVR